MGFIFRTVFWLGLAMVVLPPHARLGGGNDTADFRNVDLWRELQNLTSSAWSIGTEAVKTCDTNPGLCKAGEELWTTTVDTAGTLTAEVQNQWQKHAAAPREAAVHQPRASKKIQARVE